MSSKKDDFSTQMSRSSLRTEDHSKTGNLGSVKKSHRMNISEQTGLVRKSSSLTETTLVAKTLPDKFYYKSLRKEKHVKFDKYLMLLEERNDYKTAVEDNSFSLTAVPNFIGYLVLAIRAQFELELQKGVCFIEAKIFPSHNEVQALAEAVYINCDTYNDILSVLEDKECILMFVVLLELLQRIEERIIQASPEIMNFVRENPIFKYLRPHDFVIIDQINMFSTNCFVSQGQKKESNNEKSTLKMINRIISEYYFDEPKTRFEDIINRNKFHELFYSDLRAIKSTSRRYICKFILRNCIYFIRRYVCSTSSILRVKRHESPKETNLTSVPYIAQFAIYRMSQFLAVSSTEIKDTIDDIDDRIHFLMNIFSLHMENLWFRQNKISNVIISTEEEQCHVGCLCLL